MKELKKIFKDIKITKEKIFIPKDIIIIDIKSRIDEKSDEKLINIIRHSLDKKVITSKTKNGIHFWFRSDMRIEKQLEEILNNNTKIKNNYLSLEVSYHNDFIWNKEREYDFGGVKDIKDIDKVIEVLQLVKKEDNEIIKNIIGVKKWKTTIRDFLKEYYKMMSSETYNKCKIEDLFLEMFNYFLKFNFDSEDKEDNYNYVYQLFYKLFKYMFNNFELDIPSKKDTISYKEFLEGGGKDTNNNYSTFKKIGTIFTLLENEIIYNNYSIEDFIDHLKIIKSKKIEEKINELQESIENETDEKVIKKLKKQLEKKLNELKHLSDKVIDDLNKLFLTKFGYGKLKSKRVNFDNEIFFQLLNKQKILELNEYDITIDNICNYLVDVCGYIYHQKKIYIWDKTHYQKIEDKNIEGAIFSKFIKFYETLKINLSLISEIKIKLGIKSKLKTLPSNYIPLKNGILNLDTKNLLNSDEGIDYNIFWIFNGNYLKDFNKDSEDYKNFNNFMEVPLKEKKLKELFYLMCCSILFKDSYLKKVFFIVGSSNSGKSIMLRWINNLLPINLISSFTLEELDKTRWAKGYLNNSWVNIQGDIPISKEAINGKVIKSITGGDSISIEKKYQDVENNVILNTKIIVSSNFKPKFKTDKALYNRLILLNIDNVIDVNNEKIKEISEKVLDKNKQIKEEMLDIFLNVILSYYDEMKEKGVNEIFENEDIYPESSNKLKQELINESNYLKLWVDEYDLTMSDFVGRKISDCLGLKIDREGTNWHYCYNNFVIRNGIEYNNYNIVNWRTKMNEMLENEGFRIETYKSNGERIIRVWDIKNKKYVEKKKVDTNFRVERK